MNGKNKIPCCIGEEKKKAVLHFQSIKLLSKMPYNLKMTRRKKSL